VSKRTTILAGAAVLLIATVLAYLPATRGGFVWDDEDWVEHNPLLVDADGMWRIWFSNDQPSQYFPMVYTTFRLEYSIWGLEPLGYHVTNIVLHAINVLLVWWLLARLRVPAAWLASAVFALHPVQVESVAWITERKNVLMFFFFALALGAWLTFVDRSEQPRRGRSFYLLSLGLYVIALLAKTTASTMPAALVLTLWMKHLRVDRRRWLQITPFVVLGVAAGLLSMWWERFYQGVYPSVVYEGPIERLLIASHGVWFYLGKLAWPTSFTFSYPKWSISAADPALYIWPVLCLVATWGLWRWRSRIGRGPIAAMVFFVATLSPLLGLIMLATFVYTYVADHYQYVACIGPIALACATGHGIARRFGRQGLRLGSAVAVIVLVLLGTLTWRQGAIYASRETVWRDTLRKNPNSWLAHNNLGTALRSQGRFEEAAGHYRQALLLDRDLEGSSGRIHFNLADMLAAQGDHEQAIEHYRQALQEHPGNYLAHHNMANSMVKWDRSDDATAHYRRALEIRPDYAAGHHNLANLLRSQGNLDEALMHYERALEIDPGHANSHKGLALLLSGRGAVTEAIDHYRAALETDPDDAETHYNLGNALRSQGRLEDAVLHYRRAVDADPTDELTRNNLGLALSILGDVEGAIEQLRTALRMRPDYVDGRYNLGQILARHGRLREALIEYREVTRLRPDWPQPLTSMAFILATHPDRDVRDAGSAIELAERAAELTESDDPLVLHTLAAAYAAGGRRTSAVRTAEAALRLASARGSTALAQQIEQQLRSLRREPR
jgi:tetratricopeptide (TPR) repeat protein